MAQNTLISFDHLQAILRDYGKVVSEKYKQNLQASDRIASGELIGRVNSMVVVNGETYDVVLDLVEYWKYVEEGRKPGKRPPMDSLINWVNVKPVIPRPDENGRIPSPQQLAFLIGRKIGEEGTEGTHDLERANKDTLESFRQKIIDALTEDIGMYMQKVGQQVIYDDIRESSYTLNW